MFLFTCLHHSFTVLLIIKSKKMKTTKIILFVVLIFMSLTNYANEKVEPISTSLDARNAIVQYSDKKEYILTIKDDKGVIIYEQKILEPKHYEYSKIFDTSHLKDGNYTAELEKGYEIIIHKIKVKDGELIFLKESSNTIFKPVIRTDSNLVLISKIAFNKNPLHIVLYYKDSIILSETVKGEAILNRVYRLSEKEKGRYRVIIRSDDRTYVKNFKI